jgi:hypothetical protein
MGEATHSSAKAQGLRAILIRIGLERKKLLLTFSPLKRPTYSAWVGFSKSYSESSQILCQEGAQDVYWMLTW